LFFLHYWCHSAVAFYQGQTAAAMQMSGLSLLLPLLLGHLSGMEPVAIEDQARHSPNF
jgi:hypothetical protein